MGRREALLTEAQEHQEAMSQVIQLQLTPKGCTGRMLETSIKMLPKEDDASPVHQPFSGLVH